MSKHVPQSAIFVVTMCCLALAEQPSEAQDIYLSDPASARVLRGASGAQAGGWLEQAAVGDGDTDQDLIVGSPSWSGGTGRVSILYRGPLHTGIAALDPADAMINGVVGGGRFGSATASGYVFNNPALTPGAQRDLIVAAPGSSGDAGRVYIFAGPIRRGTHDATAARFVLTGAAGERFGAALASADLNDDGYREVIVGAPGSNHVYVFDLAGRTPGTIAAASADMIIDADAVLVGHGVGEVLEAGGDITGDGIYDLAIGVPRAYGARGVVLVFRGHRRTEGWRFPGAVAALGAANMIITGADPGDRAGQSLTFRDIVFADAGSVDDMLVGAPGADGPANGRVDAGEVYVLWGGTVVPGCDVHAAGAVCRRTLTSADVVMFGAAAGLRTGEALAGGDITRDNPDDVVLVAPGGPNGVELYVVYGTRLRSTYGSVVDLARAGEYGRRIVGRAIQSVIVFEATGEGANDIVAGVPTAEGGDGLVYVSISPKLAVTTRSVALTAVQCGAASARLDISNPSVIPLPWSIESNAAWLRVVPGTGASASGAPIAARIVAASAGLAPGTYSGRFDIESTTRHVAMFLRVSVTLTVQPSSPWRVNAHSDFTGDGCGDTILFQPRTGSWRVGGSTIRLGRTGDVPVAGDYNGDGIAEPAVYRKSSSSWHFSGTTVTWGEVGDVPVPADYDGNGTLDIAVYRPSTGAWLIRGQSSVVFGALGDVPVPADYDGDGAADVAVFSRATGEWRIRSQSPVTWGGPGDIPVPADYDADGRADIAVYRRTSGTWMVRNQFSIQWGAAHDVPAPIDTNRDGRAELVLYRRGVGTWYIRDATTGAVDTVAAGTAGDVPVVAAWSVLGTTPLDMNPDGRSEIAVWRPGTGTWFVKQSHAEYTTYFSLPWGSGSMNDVPIARDFDGDRISDIGVWRPGSGGWYVLTSSDNYAGRITVTWGSGAHQDVPVPADYDGDQRADVAVWRPGSGTWFVRTSTTNYTNGFNIAWGSGALGDKPVPGDYDGDGRADLAVWRPGTGVWFVLTSSSGYRTFTTMEWGSGAVGDVPLAADYDGDGRFDAAVYRQSTATWHIRNSSRSAATSKQWGTGGDVPIVGDFDGDGQADVTVWRPSTGVWHVSTSSSGFRTSFSVAWGSGAVNDIPIGRAGR